MTRFWPFSLHFVLAFHPSANVGNKSRQRPHIRSILSSTLVQTPALSANHLSWRRDQIDDLSPLSRNLPYPRTCQIKTPSSESPQAQDSWSDLVVSWGPVSTPHKATPPVSLRLLGHFLFELDLAGCISGLHIQSCNSSRNALDFTHKSHCRLFLYLIPSRKHLVSFVTSVVPQHDTALSPTAGKTLVLTPLAFPLRKQESLSFGSFS